MASDPPVQVQRATVWRRGLSWLGDVLASLIWLVSALLALVLAGLLAVGLWAATPLALPHTLSWVQQSLKDPDTGLSPLQFKGARGSLLGGGQIEHLTWQDGGLTADIRELTLLWSPDQLLALAFQRSLALDRWAIDALTVTDDRPPPTDPAPMQPPTDLRLPWLQAVDLSLSIGTFHWTGEPGVHAGPFQGRYRYSAATGHQLDVDALHWQEGLYTLQAQVGTDPSIAVQLRLSGEVHTPAMDELPAQHLAVNAEASGTLAGPQARIDLTATLQPVAGGLAVGPGPRLSLVAALLPWAPMPIDHADVDMQNINIAQFWPPGPQTRLDGQWRAGAPDALTPGAGWRVQGQLTNQLPRPWDQGGLPLNRLQADLELTEADLVVRQLTVELGRGQARAAGTVRRTAQGPEANGQITLTQLNLRDVWSTLPDATWNAEGQASAAGAQTRWQVRLSPAQAQDLPSLDAAGHWAGETVAIDRLQLDWLGSQLTGRVGALRSDVTFEQVELGWVAPGLTLGWEGDWPLAASGTTAQLDAPELARFQRWGRDALRIMDTRWPAGHLQDRWADWLAWDLQGQVRWHAQATPQAQGVEWQSGLQMDVSVMTPDARWEARGETRVRGRRLLTAGPTDDWLQIDILSMQGGGTHHPMLWRVALNEPLDIERRADGQLRVGAGQLHWQPVRPRSRVSAPGMAFATEPALLAWEPLTLHEGHLETRGRISQVAMSWVNAWLVTPDRPQGPLTASGLEGDVWLGATWDLSLPLTAATATTAATAPRADWRIQHERGDWSITGRVGTETRTFTSGIQTLALTGRLNGEALITEWRLDTTELGQAQGRLETRVRPPEEDMGWAWPINAPLMGDAQMHWSQLDLLAPFLPPGWRVEGKLAAQGQLTGDRQTPHLGGRIHLQQLAIRSLVDGIDFSGGELIARLQGQQMVLERLHLQGAGGPEGGTLSGEGQIGWRPLATGGWEPELDLVFHANEWRVLARADRRLILSGQIRAQLNDALLDLTGRFQALQALFLLPDEATPTLGSDVVIRGGSMPVPLHAQLPFQTRLHVTLDLGNRFDIRGLGLQTALEGELLIQARPGQLTPSLSGDIRTVRGTYRAYGQRLDIERGLIRFNGPYDNPALDILAVRPHPTQKVGVEISGNAQAPRVRLYADPDLPDSEKLAWLILGRPASGGGAEAALLQQAALALLSGQGGQRDGSLVQNLGLDEFSFQGQAVNPDGTTTAAAVTLGKRISEQLYVSYSRSVTGASGTVAVFLDLSRFITLRAQAGDDNALDIIFSREFDRWRAPRTIPPASP